MKNKKSIDSLLQGFENQSETIVINTEGKTTQYWCGVGVNAGDLVGSGGGGIIKP